MATTVKGDPRALAGMALSAAAFVVLMAVITAEALYPARYDTGDNEISDLGGTRPPDSVVLQPSAAIFDSAMVAAGALILLAALLVHRELQRRSVPGWLGLFGAGLVLVGLFPGPTAPHPYAATLTFVAAGVTALVASRAQSGPGRHVSAALGGITLTSTILGYFFLSWGPVAELGDGGIERWIAYPAVLWLATFGGYLTAGGALHARLQAVTTASSSSSGKVRGHRS